jgi:beta-glucanase (GH16 family)
LVALNVEVEQARQAILKTMHKLVVTFVASVWCICCANAKKYYNDAEWILTFEDQFEGDKLNETNWNVRTNQSHCCQLGKEELELYVPGEVFLSNSKLNIRTRYVEAPVIGPSGKTFKYTSGWIDTKMKVSQKWGKFEANCSLPSRLSRGAWPAFWLMPNANICWPTGGEIDIFEFNADPLQDSIFGSYHWAEKNECGKDKAPIPGRGYRPVNSSNDWQEEYHVYGVEWSEESIDYFVDNVKYFSRSSSEVKLPGTSMYIIINQAVDPILFPPTPKHPGEGYDKKGVFLLVDWVKVWKKK